jgi:hypothetical protein
MNPLHGLQEGIFYLLDDNGSEGEQASRTRTVKLVDLSGGFVGCVWRCGWLLL